ncbi:MAG TPA: lmo0937 family membrane protein [Terriglobales bacterium]|nr:lmo0937 family membrane protein [Terriglobales bacterium]
MVWIGVFFLGLWIAGEAMSYTLGGFIHVLLVLSIMVILSQMIRGNRGSRLAELDNSPSNGVGDKWK